MKIIKVAENNIGVRIDKFLAQEFFSLSRGEIIRNIKEGKILVNKEIIKPSYKLKENDEIESNVSFKREEVIPNDGIKLNIIYSDDNIIVINKQAGIQVHPDSNERKNTLANALVSKFPEIKDVHDESLGAYLRPGIVHRLDKDTSGVMIIARNQKTFDELKEMFQERKIHKKYVAIVYGQLKDKKGIITKAIARSESYKKQSIAGAKTKTKVRGAVTEYKQLKRFNSYSLVEARPLTGRMHQIRIHLFSIGHPVVGDKLYKLKSIKANILAKRQLLHAEETDFTLFGKKFRFSAPLPEDFNVFLKNID
ncbi:MAG: RluA family pseudouridine synthase [Parcubacteria group bacterium]|jgi:23S rRNA pseudouridine1911/1915/1917 synthase